MLSFTPDIRCGANKIPPMMQHHSGAAMAEENGCLYVMGVMEVQVVTE